MAINLDKPHLWKKDISKSVDMYNNWFMTFAPKAFRNTRVKTTKEVEIALKLTNNLKDVSPDMLKSNPKVLRTLRMSTCPPIAVDRLIGLAGVNPTLVKKMEKEHKLHSRMDENELTIQLKKIGHIIKKMADPDIFTWLEKNKSPKKDEVYRAATIVADRLCGSVANPIIRNAQEKRQLKAIKIWLEKKGYTELPIGESIKFNEMKPGTFSFRLNVPVQLDNGKKVNLPIDAVIKRKKNSKKELPILIEAKSAGDFTNVNKRRKEESIKMIQLKKTYGSKIKFILFLCGYFDSGYLGYEAAEGIDWIWEHRINDLSKLKL